MEKKTYEWRSGYRSAASLTADQAAEELDRIRNLRGSLTPQAVVEEARDDINPLHDVFEWDDTTAANEHRLWQARSMIRAVVVVVVSSEDEEPVRDHKFWNVRTEDSGNEYVPREVLVSKPDAMEYALKACKARAAEVNRDMEDLKRIVDERDSPKSYKRRVGSAATAAAKAHQAIANL